MRKLLLVLLIFSFFTGGCGFQFNLNPNPNGEIIVNTPETKPRADGGGDVIPQVIPDEARDNIVGYYKKAFTLEGVKWVDKNFTGNVDDGDNILLIFNRSVLMPSPNVDYDNSFTLSCGVFSSVFDVSAVSYNDETRKAIKVPFLPGKSIVPGFDTIKVVPNNNLYDFKGIHCQPTTDLRITTQ